MASEGNTIIRSITMLKKFFYLIFCGFFLGLSVFAPGFSGSVIAIILGIYQDLLTIISNPFKEFRKNVMFCLPLAIGAGISAILFVIAFKFLFTTYEKATYILFVGLIAGNLPIIFEEIKKHTFKKSYIIGGACAFIAALVLAILGIGAESSSSIENINSGIMALSGLAAGATALIPGMSVSMVLIIMGVYSNLIIIAESLLHMDFTYLIPFGIFSILALIGLVITSRGIKATFNKFPGFANSAVFGFMTGSLVGILIESLKLADSNFNWLQGGLALATGLVISMLFVVLGKAMEKSKI